MLAVLRKAARNAAWRVTQRRRGRRGSTFRRGFRTALRVRHKARLLGASLICLLARCASTCPPPVASFRCINNFSHTLCVLTLLADGAAWSVPSRGCLGSTDASAFFAARRSIAARSLPSLQSQNSRFCGGRCPSIRPRKYPPLQTGEFCD